MLDLTGLLSVVEYADNHQVKNVRYHLRLESVVTPQAKVALINRLNFWTKWVGVAMEGSFTHKSSPFITQGLVIITKKRKCRVLVYFH